VIDNDKIKIAHNKVGYIIKSTILKGVKPGFQFEDDGQNYTVTGLATDDECQAFCDAAGEPFRVKGNPNITNYKVVTD
jgi:hypothetical protein